MLVNFLTTFASNHCDPSFFGLKTWHHYLEKTPQCHITNFDVLGGPHGSDFVLIALALIDDLLRVAGFIAVGYIIYGGILYQTSQGSPEQTGRAQGTIQNALIGLVITVIAISFISYLGSRIG